MPRLWDISPPVHERSPVFPGDAAYRQSWNARIGPGCPVNVATLITVSRTPAHTPTLRCTTTKPARPSATSHSRPTWAAAA